jgi:hypothetical protein
MPCVAYAPMFEHDRERMTSPNYIYKSNIVEAKTMLKMKRATFNHLVN